MKLIYAQDREADSLPEAYKVGNADRFKSLRKHQEDSLTLLFR